MGDNSKGEEKLTPSLHLLNENRSGWKSARRITNTALLSSKPAEAVSKIIVQMFYICGVLFGWLRGIWRPQSDEMFVAHLAFSLLPN
ncbi:hypothetical protein DRQ12_12725 [candidate division KSB1 bacterium]|nr:MAG: hypothetical protein DRQ12_12725 [candidate division KSB1 bacterium]